MKSKITVRTFKRVLSACLTALAPLVLTACPEKIEPTPPILSEVQPPAIEASSISAALTVPVAQFISAAEAVVPKSIGAGNYNEQVNGGADNVEKGASFGYDVARGGLAFSGSGNSFRVSTGINYFVDAIARKQVLFATPIVHGSCGVGEPRRTANATLTMAVNVDQAWNLTSSSSTKVEATNRCTVTIFNIDVTDKIIGAANNLLGSKAAELDAKLVALANTRPRMESIWKQLQEPIEVTANTWLVFRPDAAGTTSLSVDNEKAKIGATVRFYPEIVYGAKPVVAHAVLPPNQGAVASNAFSLRIPITGEYAALQSQLLKALNLDNGTLRYPPVGPFYIRPTDAAIYGYGNQLVVRIAFKGSAKGVLYFLGTPKFDATSNTFSMPDLDYTLETKNLLAKLVNWHERDRFRDELRNRIRFDLSSQVNQARALATQAIVRDVGPFHLDGRVTSFRLIGLWIKPGSASVSALLSADGTLDLTTK